MDGKCDRGFADLCIYLAHQATWLVHRLESPVSTITRILH